MLRLSGDLYALLARQARVGRFPPAVDVLRAAGFEDLLDESCGGAGDGADDTLVLSPETENRGRVRKVWMLAMLELCEFSFRRARILPACQQVREICAAEVAAIGGTAPPPPAVDERALAAAVTAAQVQAAAFDPMRSIITRVSDTGGLETRTLEGTLGSSGTSASPPPRGDRAAAPGEQPPLTTRPGTAAGPATQVVAGPAGPLTVPVMRPHSHATPTERRVFELRARAQAAQLEHMPRSRELRVALFDPAAAAAQEAAMSASTPRAAASADDDDVGGRADPEAQRLLAQYVRSKISAAAADQDGRVSGGARIRDKRVAGLGLPECC